MSWWFWLVLGMLLLVTELLLPSGFFLFFLGVAGILLASLVFFGMVLTFSVAWLLFFVISIGLSLLVRRPLANRFVWAGDGIAWAVAGDEVETLEDIPPGSSGVGKLCKAAETAGTIWRVRNSSAATLTRGGRYRLIRVEGITLVVE